MKKGVDDPPHIEAPASSQGGVLIIISVYPSKPSGFFPAELIAPATFYRKK